MFPGFDKLTRKYFAQNCSLFSAAGYQDPEAAVESLIRLRAISDRLLTADLQSRNRTVPNWFKILKRILTEAPYSETVLSVIDQYVQRSTTPDDALLLFENSARSLELLARIASSSPFLTQIVLRDTDALQRLALDSRTAAIKSREDFYEEAMLEISSCSSVPEQLQRLRIYQKRELLRIGTCDAFGLMALKIVTLQLSLLADAMIQTCLHIVDVDDNSKLKDNFCILALGKLGGEELNYSSDIDLILIAKMNSPQIQRFARKIIDGLHDNLPTGFLYRVDLRLRPWGDAGPLVSTIDAFQSYLHQEALVWERQALLKARIVAGNSDLGRKLLDSVRPELFQVERQEIRNSILSMKQRIEKTLRQKSILTSEVKLGAGSIRDVEFVIQSLQLMHGKEHPDVINPNSLESLVRLVDYGLMSVSMFRQLRDGYVFMRTIEHALQLFHNQQVHTLPSENQQRDWLASRLDYPDGDTLFARFNEHRKAIRALFENHFEHTVTIDNGLTPEYPGYEHDMIPNSAAHDGDIRQNYPVLQSIEDLLPLLNEQRCVQIQLRRHSASDSSIQLLVCSLECPGMLAILCATLFKYRLDIRHGLVGIGVIGKHINLELDANHFVACLTVQENTFEDVSRAALPLNQLQSLLLNQLAGWLTQQRTGQTDHVRRELLNTFCEHLQSVDAVADSVADVQLNIQNQSDEVLPSASQESVEIEITGDDSVGFLFELANALAVCQFRIHSAVLSVQDGRVRDTLHVVNFDGSCPQQSGRLEELRTAVVLIKQFTHWLPSNSAPNDALLRFRDLLHRILTKADWRNDTASLSQPAVLRNVARVLGMSRFLWEDMLTASHDQLFPLVTHPEELKNRIQCTDLELELSSQLDTSDLSDKTLNNFKDRHLFRIDLRHVLGYCRPFGAFSDEITELAETVVTAATRISWSQLELEFGLPRKDDGEVCNYTLVALGKFGGVEMGFASDIELFLVYESQCHTDGDHRLSAGSFFERLVTRVSEIIVARHDGIFQIDLRVRPYGQAGSPAVELGDFRRYYSPDGDAWPYEQQSLVKMRCLAGDSDFGNTVLSTAHKIIYESASFDFDAMRGMREKQIRQLVRGGTINAKLSEGGLVDCEYAVQAIQLTFGKSHKKLRSPNTLSALNAAADYKLISPDTFRQVSEAYIFLRELIDCLRMVRGNAHDLTVPPVDSVEYRQLERRMKLVHESQVTLQELEDRMRTVVDFRDLVERICRAD